MRKRTAAKPARARARVSALALAAATGATGLLPPRARYGYVHRITRVLLQKRLPTVQALDNEPTSPTAASASTPSADLTCVLVAGPLDVGGIGSVVELLATELPSAGITPVVLCVGDGARAERIRGRGVDVRSAFDQASVLRALELIGPDVVQLHGAPGFLETAAELSGIPLVPVMHNTEIHYSTARWRELTRLVSRSSAAVAVSDLVRTFHAARLPAALATRIAVIPNATYAHPSSGIQRREAARKKVERAVGRRFGEDVLFVCLARYDAQKNIAGTVASFLRCVETGVPAQLVIAGEPSDWVEFRRSDAIRRGSPSADRVHLLAASDARTLLAAADAFLLNSFFEGWPVAATEAANAGLPLVLSDVGGARELVARDPDRSILIANPASTASSISDARVERSRRGATKQRNSSELGTALRRIVHTVRLEQPEAPARRDPRQDVTAMIDAHARVLRDAAHTRATTVASDLEHGR